MSPQWWMQTDSCYVATQQSETCGICMTEMIQQALSTLHSGMHVSQQLGHTAKLKSVKDSHTTYDVDKTTSLASQAELAV